MFPALLCTLLLLHGSLGEIVFRCPSCTAERQAACPKLTTSCEIVREPGCGCCPVCARQKGELCGVYTPRCGSGLRCYPSANSELQLEQLIQGLGRCENKVDLEPTMTNQESGHSGELNGTRSPPVKKPGKENNYQHIKEIAVKQHLNNKKTKMYSPQDDPKTPHPRQCNMSSHGQRGECWCVNPYTGVQIPSSPKVRGDPNCSQYYGGPELEPPTSQQK
ncbi:hypothetical protein cypCar_00007834 [Cyprinus carpio]|nr:hypothetical protein cypCar_00007834 [Cyprinus carpio]